MRKKCLLVIALFLTLCPTLLSQTGRITGVVQDSSANQSLENASVVLLQAKDSFIVADTRTDKKGSFSFSNLPDTTNDYVLFFTYPKYVAYSHKASMLDAKNGVLDFGKVNLILQEKLLEEVLVKSRVAAIKIKGDTTEYVADSFKVQANANVEDLLKQLPGLQVDQYGNITAQGQKVKKVLVDGEEFFSDDPTLVTRNLRADMIDKVQVFDKKSDAATFTGIDDGIKDKTINLKIKEDKNHGIFGKVDAGAGTDKHYNAQGMLNAFKGKRKMAVYATTSNIGRVGLGAADKQKIGDEAGGEENYSGKGLPTVTSGGAHYDKKWNTDKESINGNYKFNFSNVKGDETTISQNNLPTGLILNHSSSRFTNDNHNHSGNAKYIHKADTTSTFTIYADGAFNNSKNSNTGEEESTMGNNNLLYKNQSASKNDYNLNTYNVNLSWEKKLKKYGRTISLYLNNNLSEDKGNGESRTVTEFYNSENNVDSTYLLNLQKKMNDNWHTHQLNINYTEPLSSKLSLLINYTGNIASYRDDKRSFNLGENTPIPRIDTTFSTTMDASVLGNQLGAALNYSYKKAIFKIGNNLKLVKMDIHDLLDENRLKKQYTNWNPTLSYNYKFNSYKSLNIAYNGSSTNPERTQLLPFRYNNGPLVTYLPNADLKNSFTHNLTGYFYSSKIASNIYMGGNFGYTLINNPITQSLEVAPDGSYTYQYVNMSGRSNNNFYSNIYYSKKINPIDLQAGGYASFTGGKTFSLINSALNELNYKTYTLGVEIFKTKLKQYSIYMQGSGGYTFNKSSLQPDTKNNYFFYTLNPSIDVYFLKKFQLHTEANYFWQQKTQAFNDNFDRMIWNAWIGRNFLKNDQLTIKISCNDILNENNGYSRTATNTFFSENRYTTIRRFFMIGAVWSFTKFNNIKQ